MGSQAIWTDPPFRYSDEHIEHIDPDMWSKKGPEIEAAADNYRIELMLWKETPKAAQVNEELRKLSKSIRKVYDASGDLDDLTLDAIQIWANGLSGGTTLNNVMVWRGELFLLALELEETADENSKPGPPRDEARRRFVYGLAEIWEEIHGEWPRRKHDDQEGDKGGPFHDFVRACEAPFDSAGKGLDGQIKAVVARGKNRHLKPPD